MPAEEKEKVSLDFGIEDVIDGAGDRQVLDSFYGTTGDPNDILDKDDTTSSTTNKSTTKPVPPKNQLPPKKVEEKKEEDVVDDDIEGKVLGDGESDNTDKDATNQQQQAEGDKSTMAALAEEFVKMGIFLPETEDEIIDPTLAPEEFLKLYEKNQKRNINDTIESFLGRFGEDYREMFDAVFVNGVDPKSYLQTFTQLQDIASLDMTQEASQEKVYKEYWRRQGFTEDKIDARLQKAKVNGDLEEDSIDFHKTLVEQDAKELQTKAAEKEKKTIEDRRVKQIFAQSANKILLEKLKEKEYDGIPLTDQIAKSAFEYVTQERYKLSNGDPLTEFDKAILELRRPENTGLKMKLALLLMNNLDLTKVKVKERNADVTRSFDWATKNRGVTNTSKNGTKVSQKEAEPFI